jgi:hypothetical protein
MNYFDTLPKFIYTNTDNIPRIATDILTRSNIIPKLQNSPLLYYKYTIQDSDTPEIVASKYYGDPYRYWIILYVNQMFDAKWDWPLNYHNFSAYMEDKYSSAANGMSVLAYTQTTIDHYEKTITTIENDSQQVTTDIYLISSDEYANVIPSTITYSVANTTVTRSISARSVSIYDNESTLNDNKRNINLLNSQYVSKFESEFIQLMSK